jgi:phosphate transport system substrate-binding protein
MKALMNLSVFLRKWLGTLSIGILFTMLAWLPARSETLDIVGTGDGMVILEALARTFERSHPGDKIHIPESIGSSGGIKAIGSDKNMLGRVARKLKNKEKPYGLTHLPIAKFPVVFFVNKSVDVDGLTSQQVNDIYSGKVVNWQSVGGSKAKIRVVRREEGDSSLKNLRVSFPGFKDIAITKRSKTATLTTEIFEIVTSKSGAIGFGPYADAVAENVTVLKIDNKQPTDTNYPSFGVLALIFKEVNRNGLVSAFLEFLTTSAANKAIEDSHALPYQ